MLAARLEKARQFLTDDEQEELDALLAALDLDVLEEEWKIWAPVMFPNYVPGEFADFHAHAWTWFWDIKAFQPIEPLLLVFPRGFAKSTTLQLGTVSTGARGTRRYVWYVSETQNQADAHVQTVGSLLSSSNIEKYYPDLASKKVGRHGNQSGWRRNRFWTNSDFIIDGLGMDTAGRGVKLEDKRPDLIIFDDIDGRHDSPNITQKKIEVITTSLMPAGALGYCTFAFGQNLIHRDASVTQLVDGRLKLMKNKRFFGVVPALRNFDYQEQPDGSYKIAGDPTWSFFDLAACQKKVDEEGIESFLTERQHEVNRPLTGAIFGMWNEIYHVITDEEFAAGWRDLTGKDLEYSAQDRVIMPDNFRIARYQDVGTTKDHPNVTSWWNRPSEAHPLSDSVFCHREMVFPEIWWDSKAEFKDYSVGEIAEEIYETEMAADERDRINDSDCFLSHEGSSEVLTYDRDIPPEHRINWNKWKGDYKKLHGVGIMKNFMRVNPAKEHPFRRYPAGHPQAGRKLMGCPRFFLIVKKGQGELYLDDNGQLRVRQPVDADGMRRARWEIPQYRLPQNASGEEADAPKRIRDDWISTAKAAAANLFPQPNPPTKAEATEIKVKEIAPQLSLEKIMERAPEERQGALARRNQVIGEINRNTGASRPASKLAVLKNLRSRR